MRVLAQILTLLMAALLLTSCAVNPATGSPNLVTMSQSREMAIGEEEHQKVMASMRVTDDEALAAYVDEVGQRLAAVSHRPDLDYTFTVIDSPEINAFALPGGYVYINRGLLAFLKSEDELAAVLAHEIGHITARHAVQQHSRGTLGSAAAGVGGFVAAVATGNVYIGSELAQVGSMWTQAGVSGFGREHELEADALGAEYLYNAGYNPRAMIDVLSVLKSQEDFNVRVAGSRAGYHGLFATHPRNDVRLQQAIFRAGELDEDQLRETDHAVFRQHLDGMPFGERRGAQARNRYYQDTLGYTLIFPDEWRIEESFSSVSGSKADAAILRVDAQRLTERKAPHQFLRENLGYDDLQQTEILSQYRLEGFTGVRTDAETGNHQRIAVIYMGLRAFIFTGEVHDADRKDELDRLLMSSIRTFRAIQGNERSGSSGDLRIRYVQVGENFSWPALARMSRVSEYAEETLRLLNGYYPRGNPQPGEWIKILQ